jgi:hypothetical protein
MKVTADEVLCFVISCIEMLSYPKGHLLAPTLEAWDSEAPWRRRLRDLRRRGWIEMETSIHAHRFGLLQKSGWIRPDLPGLDFTPPFVDMPSGAGGLVVLQVPPDPPRCTLEIEACSRTGI